MKISAALIMKNEEENLPRLLDSLQGKFDEIVVVDTGSSDKSIEIAKSYGCKVYEHTWNGFADARNYAISRCSGEWIWHFDADFELEEKEFEKFRRFLLHLQKEKNQEYIKVLGIHVRNLGIDGIVKAISTQAFLHRNLPQIYWVGKIHEQINTKMSFLLPVYVNHYGFQDDEVQKRKALRNLAMLLQDIQTKKGDRFERLFYILQSYAILTYYDQDYFDEAKPYIAEFQKSSEIINDKFLKIYGTYYIALIYKQVDRYGEAYDILETNHEHFKKIPDLLILSIELSHLLGKKDLAKRRCLETASILGKLQNDTAIIDRLADFIQMIQERCFDLFTCDDISLVQIHWKKEKTYYLGLLLLSLFEKCDRKRFEKFLEKLIKLFDDEILHVKRMFVFLHNGDFVKTQKLARKLLQTNPSLCKAKEVLGVLAIKERNFQKAISFLSDVVQSCKDLNALENLTIALIQAGYEQEAQKIRDLLKK